MFGKLSSRDLLFVAVGAASATALYWCTSKLSETLTDKGLRSNQGKGRNGAKDSNETFLVSPERLKKFVESVFLKCGLGSDDAKIAAEVLILADLRGIDSHGVARLMAYFSMLKNKIINPTPNIRIIRETDSSATVDGDNGLGLVVGPKCNEIAMMKAKKAGTGWVSVRNTNHFGIAGSYPLESLKHDMIGISMTNSGSVVSPLRGKERFLGTNPIAIAFPGTNKERPMVIDFATSVVPWGKVEEYSRQNKPLSSNWAIGKDGKQCLDPDVVLKEGALLNLGGQRETSGHKGYCLAAMVDILCAVLSGGNWGPTVDGFTTNEVNYGDSTAEGRCKDNNSLGGNNRIKGICHFFGAMRIDGFRDVEAFKETMDKWMGTFRRCKPIDQSKPVMIPGDPEWAAFEERSKTGIPVKLAVCADMVDISKECGVPLPFDESKVDFSGVKRVVIATT